MRMRLRIARKIVMCSDEDKARYTENQLQRADVRYRRCKSAKETDAFIADLIENGVFDRLRWKMEARAKLDRIMESDEEREEFRRFERDVLSRSTY